MTTRTSTGPAMAALHERHQREDEAAGQHGNALYSVSQLARQLGVTARTIELWRNLGDAA
ncbi:helix-turn-helix domain-containing protein [Acidiphilium multivorum]|uniref:helix-turn-helix domain-containing protein n=1 Tax=Acidiphilium multivorum TaxID=62140 RepID=UPI001F4C452D|nr:helix-turn-helix domain-containing protein [Acidiphilium multivorum]